MQNKLLLPRTYLSASQMECWLSNPARYRKEYFENGDKLDTKYLRFGSDIAKMIEEGRYKELFPDLIVYDEHEYEIRCEIAGIPILSYLDSYDPVNNVFRDNKTGIVPWTQTRVQKSNQMLFYATALKWKTGKMPEYCDLDWLETRERVTEKVDFWRDGDTIINVTGRIISFHREFDEREIERMENLIIRVANEISEAYIKFLEEI